MEDGVGSQSNRGQSINIGNMPQHIHWAPLVCARKWDKRASVVFDLGRVSHRLAAQLPNLKRGNRSDACGKERECWAALSHPTNPGPSPWRRHFKSSCHRRWNGFYGLGSPPLTKLEMVATHPRGCEHDLFSLKNEAYWAFGYVGVLILNWTGSIICRCVVVPS